jgi:hypothetical protein
MSEQTPVQAFEHSLQLMLEAHHHHAGVMVDTARATEAPRSRRALYNAIKAYRKAETAVYHAATGEPPPADDKT